MSSRWVIIRYDIVEVGAYNNWDLSKKLTKSVQDQIDVGWTPHGSPVYLGKDSDGLHHMMQTVVRWEQM